MRDIRPIFLTEDEIELIKNGLSSLNISENDDEAEILDTILEKI